MKRNYSKIQDRCTPQSMAHNLAWALHALLADSNREYSFAVVILGHHDYDHQQKLLDAFLSCNIYENTVSNESCIGYQPLHGIVDFGFDMVNKVAQEEKVLLICFHDSFRAMAILSNQGKHIQYHKKYLWKNLGIDSIVEQDINTIEDGDFLESDYEGFEVLVSNLRACT